MKEQVKPEFIQSMLHRFVSRPRQHLLWKANTHFAEGAKVRSGNHLYIAFSSGTTSNNPPTHTEGKANDGSVIWYHVQSLTDQRDLGESLFIGFGRVDEGWDTEPKDLDGSHHEEISFVNNTLAFYRVFGTDMVLGAKRNRWSNGKVFKQYPDNDSYVTVGSSIYRCLSSPGNPSTEEPSGTGITPFELSDGYVWLFLGEYSESLNQRFGTEEHFPIQPLFTDDGSMRAIVQTLAKNGSISGFGEIIHSGTFVNPEISIVGEGVNGSASLKLTSNNHASRFILTNGGSRYKPGTTFVVAKEHGSTGEGATGEVSILNGRIQEIQVTNQGQDYQDATVIIVGDGQGASATANITSGYITSITINDSGDGYSLAKVFLIPGQSGAVSEAIIAPIGGHGKEITKEIPISSIIVNKRLNAIEGSYMPDGAIHQVGLYTGITGESNSLLGPNNPLYGHSWKQSADTTGARLLQISNIRKIEHNSDTFTEITLTLSLT